MRIFIIDNNIEARIALKNMLKAYAECFTSACSMDVWSFIKKTYEVNIPFDCIFLSIDFSCMISGELLKRIRQFEQQHAISFKKRTRVILICDESVRNDIELNNDCDAVMTKPLSEERVVGRIKDLISELKTSL